MCGGHGHPSGLNRGYFVRPTVFADVTPDMEITYEEIIGPLPDVIPRCIQRAQDIARTRATLGLSKAAAQASCEKPRLNEWALSGNWTVDKESAVLNKKDGSIVYRFHARDLHLVLGPAPDGKPIRFQVTIDGHAPGNNRGMDADQDGMGTVTSERLYQLVRQSTATGPIEDHTFEIHFFDPGVEAYSFTFG